MLGPRFFRISHDLSPNLNAPRMARIHLEKGISSCATGYDSMVMTRSAGEAIERHLCYCDSEYSCGNAKISELEEDIARWFRAILPNDKSSFNYESHQYNLVEVKELTTQKKFMVPLVAFTLGKSPDDDFYGFRDSSGTALHNTYLNALTSARNEYCERQALSLCWYYGHCLSYLQLTIKNIDHVVKSSLPFLYHLLITGRVFLFDISLIKPVRTFLAVYFSKKGPVYYSAGASGSEDIDEAIHKALLELYQAYILMVNISSEKASKIVVLDDEILKGYYSFNNIDSYEKWGFILKRKNLLVDEFKALVNYRKEFYSEKILSCEKVIRFHDESKTLYFNSLKGVNGFSSMSINKYNAEHNKIVARYYGYYNQINTGAIAFA